LTYENNYIKLKLIDIQERVVKVLAQKYIQKIIESGQQADDKLNKNDADITVLDIQKALGELDKVLYNLEAAQILLREELKDRRGNNETTIII
jgi:hypothetical protein